jgi:hypothetical protein
LLIAKLYNIDYKNYTDGIYYGSEDMICGFQNMQSKVGINGKRTLIGGDVVFHGEEITKFPMMVELISVYGE